MKKYGLGAGVAFLIILLLSSLLSSATVHANFNANNLIDDYTFNNTGTMGPVQIDNFLNSFGGSCISENNGFLAPDPTGYSPSGGYTYGGNVTAGKAIYDAAQAYNLNPQVILTTLQKEQSLVTGTSGCSVLRYVGAMGYGCPDGGTSYSYSGVNLYTLNGTTVSSVSGTCVNTAAKAGFSQQVIHATWLLKFGEQRSEGNVNWAIIKGNWNNSDDPTSCYGGPMTQGNRQRCPGGSSAYYDGITTIDGSSVHMDTGATASLYWYTPHLHGNQSFETIFQSWFGATTGQGFQLAISDDTNDLRQWVVYGTIKQYVPDSQTIHAWGLQNVPLTTMPAAQLAAITTGPPLARLFIVNGGSNYYFVDNARAYALPSLTYLSIWNISGMTISSVNNGLASLPSFIGPLTAYINVPNSATTYMLDGSSGGQTLLRPYGSADVFAAIEGSAAVPTPISNELYGQLNTTVGTTLASALFANGGNQYMAIDGTKRPLVGGIQALYPSNPQNVSAGTISRLDLGPAMAHLIQLENNNNYYVVDSGTKHLLSNPALYQAWLTPGTYSIYVSQGFANLIPDGTPISGYSADVGGQLYLVDYYKTTVSTQLDHAYRTALPPISVSAQLMALFSNSGITLTQFFQAAGTPWSYMLDNSGVKHVMDTGNKLVLWGAYNTGIPLLPGNLTGSITAAPSPLSVYVSDGTTEYVMVDGQKQTVSPAQKALWGLSSPQIFSDGTLSNFSANGALSNKFDTHTGAYYFVSGGVSYGTVDHNIGAAWGLTGAPESETRLIQTLIGNYSSLTRFVRSNNTSNYTMYLIDAGVWYQLKWSDYINFGGTSQPMIILAPDGGTTIANFLSPVVHDDTSGQYFVIDSGGYRNFPAQMILDQWTNWESLSVNTLSDSFINSLPYRGIVERTIKSPNSPAVYTVKNGQKDWILYPDTYNRYYAPYNVVGDPLVQALTNGPNV